MTPATPPAGDAAVAVAAYLARLGWVGPAPPTAQTLAALHLAHLRTVPFENLDVHLGRPIRLDEAALFAKIVGRRRGGFCYELNGLFAALLQALGFAVDLVGCEMPTGGRTTLPAFDHLALRVHAADGGGPWLADVGAGRGSFATPLPLRAGSAWSQEQPAAGAAFRIVPDGQTLAVERRELAPTAAWEHQYRLSSTVRTLADFAESCRYHQTSAESRMTRGRLCSRLTASGRLTLAERCLIVTEGEQRTERELADEGEVAAALRDHFGIDLAGGGASEA